MSFVSYGMGFPPQPPGISAAPASATGQASIGEARPTLSTVSDLGAYEKGGPHARQVSREGATVTVTVVGARKKWVNDILTKGNHCSLAVNSTPPRQALLASVGKGHALLGDGDSKGKSLIQ